jgi:hypothetical protein
LVTAAAVSTANTATGNDKRTDGGTGGWQTFYGVAHVDVCETDSAEKEANSLEQGTSRMQRITDNTATDQETIDSQTAYTVKGSGTSATRRLRAISDNDYRRRRQGITTNRYDGDDTYARGGGVAAADYERYD